MGNLVRLRASSKIGLELFDARGYGTGCDRADRSLSLSLSPQIQTTLYNIGFNLFQSTNLFYIPFMKFLAIAPVLALAATVRANCATSGTCADQGTYKYEVVLDSTGTEDPGTCQGGFLDNLRGQCGDVEEWGCTSTSGNAVTSFPVPSGSDSCLAAAISLSQCGLSVHCG